jgi:hypothetical protein
VVTLAFLAPDVVEDIAAGRQPTDLTVQKLLGQTQFTLGLGETKANSWVSVSELVACIAPRANIPNSARFWLCVVISGQLIAPKPANRTACGI